MEIIRTWNNLVEIRQKKKFEQDYLDYIEKHLKRIWYTFGDEPIEEHSDRPTAELAIIEGEQDLGEEKMEELGIPSDLLKVPLEYVDQVEIDDMTIYIIGITKTNEMLLECFLNPKHFTKSIKDWLAENSVSSDYYKIDDMSPEDSPF